MDNIIIKTEIKEEPTDYQDIDTIDGFEDHNVQNVEPCDYKFQEAPDGKVLIKKEIKEEDTASKPRQFPCPECNLVFDTLYKRKHHKITRHEEPRFACKDCDKKFHYFTRWRNHSVIHDPGRTRKRTIKPERRETDYVNKVVLEDTVTNIKTEITSEDTILQPQDHQRKPKKSKYNPNGPYPCPVCGKEYSSFSGMNNHKVQHRPPKFECTECGKKFHQQYLLLVHMKIHEWHKQIEGQPKFNILECPICKKTFDTPGKRKHHKLITHGEALYQCKICEKKFHYKASLKVHVVVHDPVRKMRMTKRIRRQKKEKAKQRALKKGLPVKSVQKKPKKFQCAECGRKFQMQYKLAIHARIHDNPQSAEKPKHNLPRDHTLESPTGENVQPSQNESDVKDTLEDTTANTKTETVLEDTLPSQDHTLKGSPTEESLLTLDQVVPQFECPQCLEKFHYITHLSRHQQIHTKEFREKRYNLVKRPFPCLQCPKKFQYLSNLRRHERVHAKQNMEKDLNNETQGETQDSTVPSQSNSQSSEHSTSSQQELQPELTPLKAPTVKCPLCPYMFYTTQQVIWHQRKHRSALIACDQCTDFFRTELQLQNHRDSKHACAEQPCDRCDEILSSHADLYQHMKVVHKTRNRCVECKKTFHLTNNLQLHCDYMHTKKESINNEEPKAKYQCSSCPEAFTHYYLLLRHEAVHRNKPSTIPCDMCERSFISPVMLDFHKVSVHGCEPAGDISSKILTPCV
ncbi:zinc finger protein 91-like isoform X2 [Armigeres subalbatus]